MQDLQDNTLYRGTRAAQPAKPLTRHALTKACSRPVRRLCRYLGQALHLALLPICVALLGFSHIAEAWQDSLTAAEEQMAIQLTRAVSPIRASELPLGVKQLIETPRSKDTHPLARETLLVELTVRKNKKNRAKADIGNGVEPLAGRIAEVFVFDYSSATASRYLVDLSTEQVLKQQKIDSVHLPLNEREQAAAVAAALADPILGAKLRDEYRHQFGNTLDDLTTLEMKVSIWKPEPSNSHVAATNCRQERCALISAFTRSNFSFSTEPVVNLMRMTVSTEALQ